jgi:signal transduction histidine kinase
MDSPARPPSFAPPPAEVSASAWRDWALHLLDVGRFPEAREACTAMLRLAQAESGSDFFEALITTAVAHGRLGEFGAALAYLEEASRLAATDEQRFKCLKLTGNCRHGMDDHELALATYREAWPLAVGLGGGHLASILNNIGVVQRELGDIAAARESYERALELHAAGAPGHRMVRTNLGSTLLAQGDFAGVGVLFHQSLREAQETGDRMDEGLARAGLAELAWKQGRWEESRAEFARALGMLKECGEVRLHQMVLMERAAVLAQTGRDDEEALTLSHQALAAAEKVGARRLLAALTPHVDLLSRTGRWEEAVAAARRLASLSVEVHRRDSSGRLAALRVLHDLERLKLEAEMARIKNEDLTHALAEAELQRGRAERAQAFTQGVLEMAAHDLRNPVGALDSILDLLQLETNPTEREELTRLAREQTRVTLELLARLLDSALVQRGEIRLRREAVDLHQLTLAASRAHAAAATAKQQRLVLPEPRSHPPVEGDPVRLRQVIDNLLSNAIKYSPPGATLRAGVEGDEHGVEVRVTDEGPGVLEADRERIFEPFVRLAGVKPTGGEESVGLGLHLARELSRAHGGSLTIETGPGGRGSVFVLRLPFPSQA